MTSFGTSGLKTVHSLLTYDGLWYSNAACVSAARRLHTSAECVLESIDSERQSSFLHEEGATMVSVIAEGKEKYLRQAARTAALYVSGTGSEGPACTKVTWAPSGPPSTCN